MRMYEARPGLWLCEGVSIAENEAAVARNWPGPEDHEFFPEHEFLERIWVQKNGVEVEIQDMSNDHLLNAIRMLRRRERTKVIQYGWLIEEAEERGLDTG